MTRGRQKSACVFPVTFRVWKNLRRGLLLSQTRNLPENPVRAWIYNQLLGCFVGKTPKLIDFQMEVANCPSGGIVRDRQWLSRNLHT